MLLVRLLVLTGAAGAMYAGISPARLEANLGILPIDIYTTPQYTDIYPGSVCHTVNGITPQSCVEEVLAYWKQQGVTGVRFQFALGDGEWQVSPNGTGPFYSSYSTPFTAAGGLNPTWSANLAAFFADLRAAGIANVTLSSTFSYYWSGWNNPVFQTTQTLYDTCIGSAQTYYFYPWVPFGLTVSGSYPLPGWPEFEVNNGYNCSPANPGFWGWQPFLNLVGEIASDAVAAGVNIEEFEIESELDLLNFTTTARLIYDNTTTTPVLADIGSVLARYGFSASAATYGTAVTNPSVPGYDCGSLYGDSALLLNGSELLAARGGAVIGFPGAGSFAANNGLLCGGSISGMIAIPPSPPAPPAMPDFHVYACVGPCSTSPDVTSTSETIYNDIYWFLFYRGLLGTGSAMIGETSSNSATWAGYGCDATDNAEASQNAAGFLASLLYSQYGANSVLRPWGWMSSVSPVLCESPGNIGAPGGPYAP